MRVAVFGAGGVGGYFGGRLAEAGVDVTFIARGDHLRAMRSNGLRINSPAGSVTIAPVQATDAVADVGPVDLVVLGVKSWQVPEAAEQLRPLVGAETIVLPLQNGVDAAGQLAAVLGAEHVVGGLCAVSSRIDSPGVIRHSGGPSRVVFGETSGEISERIAGLQELFAPAIAVEAIASPNIHAELWRKFVLISSWGGVGAVTRSPIGVIRGIPETRQLLVRALEEGVAVGAQVAGLAESIVGETLNLFAGLPPGFTASMQRDIMAGRPSELQDQNGAMVRIGREHNVATPVHAFLYHSLLPMERRARDPDDWDRLAGVVAN